MTSVEERRAANALRMRMRRALGPAEDLEKARIRKAAWYQKNKERLNRKKTEERRQKREQSLTSYITTTLKPHEP